MTIPNRFASSLKLSAYCALFLFFVAPYLRGGVEEPSELVSYTIEYISDHDYFEVKENASNLSLRFRCGGLTNTLQRVKAYYRAEPYSEMAAPPARPARPGLDFEPVTGVLEFSFEKPEGIIQVPLIDNRTRDGSRAFVVRLSDIPGGTPHSEVYGYIRDDDTLHLEQAIPVATLGMRSVSHLQPLSDGDLLVAGTTAQRRFRGSDHCAVRLRPDGSLNTAWGSGGLIAWSVFSRFEYSESASARFFPNGSVWIEVFVRMPGQSFSYTLQYDANGEFERQVEGNHFHFLLGRKQSNDGVLLKDGSTLVGSAECSLTMIDPQGVKKCLDNKKYKHLGIISADLAADGKIAIVRGGDLSNEYFSTFYSPITGEQPWVDLQMTQISAFAATTSATWRAQGDLLIRTLPPTFEPTVGVARKLFVQKKSNPVVQLLRSGDLTAPVSVECTIQPYPIHINTRAIRVSATFEAGSATAELALPHELRFTNGPAMNYMVTIDQAPGMRLSDWRTAHLVIINDIPSRNGELRLYPTYSKPFPSMVSMLRGNSGDTYLICSSPEMTSDVINAPESDESYVYIPPEGLAIELIPALYSHSCFFIPVPLQ